MLWTTACPDWERRIVEGRSLIPFDPLFPDEAEARLRDFRELRLADLPGAPTIGQVGRPWLFEFAASIFGAYDAETGRRLIREFLLLISKKNTKSTTAAGIMMTALLWNWREGSEFLILAPTVDVAGNAFKPAREMVRKDADLSALMHVQDHTRSITHRTTGASLRVIAADSESAAGTKAAGVLVDELWLFGKRPGAEDMLREATGGLASRPEGFVIMLSTQSNEPPAGVFRQRLKYARDVRDGKIVDPEFLPVLYEFPRGMIERKEHLEPKNFYVTNPNLGASVDLQYLEREHRKAVASGEETLRGFLAKHLDVEIGVALGSDYWAGAPFWEACAEQGLQLDDVLERCEVVTVGVDGGGLDDLLGLTVAGRERDTGRWLTWSHAWAHPSVLERRKSEAARFRDFERDADLTLVGRVGDDVAAVAALVQRCDAAGVLDKIGVDTAGIGSIVDAIVAAGIAADRVVGIPQGWKLNGAILTAERRLAGRELVHGGRPLMAWCVGNARVEEKGNAILITKQASGRAKIDPLMALLNACALLALNPVAKSAPSVEVW